MRRLGHGDADNDGAMPLCSIVAPHAAARNYDAD